MLFKYNCKETVEEKTDCCHTHSDNQIPIFGGKGIGLKLRKNIEINCCLIMIMKRKWASDVTTNAKVLKLAAQKGSKIFSQLISKHAFSTFLKYQIYFK